MRALFKYSSWIVLGFLVLVGLIASIYFSIQPRPVPKIRYSFFESPSDLGLALTERLRLEISGSPLVFFGVGSAKRDQYEVALGVIEALKREGLVFDVVVADPNLSLKDLIPHQEEIDIQREFERFMSGIKAGQAQGKRMLFVLPAIYATTLIAETPVAKLKSDPNIKFIVFTLSNFPTKADEEKQLDYPCVPETKDLQGTRNLGCMIIGKAKTLYRKKNTEHQAVGLVDQVGLSEYLVLFNPSGL